MECTLYLSDNCNLRCKYCYEGKSRISGQLSEKDLGLAIDYIINNSELGDRIDITFLGGEPLLNKKMLYKAIEIINDKYQEYVPNIFYHITTNGILVDDLIIDLFEKNEFEVSISIDGNHATHSLNRVSLSGKDEYNLIISNMKKMISEKINLIVRMTVTLNNVHMLYDNVKYFYDMGVKHINVGLDELGAWTDKELNEFDESLELLDEYYLNKVIDDDEKILSIYDYKLASYIYAREPVYCSGGTKGHIVINSKGEFYPCGYVTNNKDWYLGDLTQGLDEKKFLKTVKENVRKESSCRDCEIAYTCCGAKCGFLNYAMTGCLNGNSEVTCKLQKIIYAHNVVVLRKMYKMKNNRVINMLSIAKENKLELGPLAKAMI